MSTKIVSPSAGITAVVAATAALLLGADAEAEVELVAAGGIEMAEVDVGGKMITDPCLNREADVRLGCMILLRVMSSPTVTPCLEASVDAVTSFAASTAFGSKRSYLSLRRCLLSPEPEGAVCRTTALDQQPCV